MNIYIMADIEGISGIYCREQVLWNERYYAEGRELMTRDINICAAACKAAGADKVFVHDCHGVSGNVIWSKLSGDIDYVFSGIGMKHRFADVIKETDGVILLGYHAMAGTPEAVLEHTMSSVSFQNIWLNGKKCGEIAIDSGILGDMGIPVIMVSGDDKTCREAEEFIPGVVTAEVKKGSACMGALLLPPEKAEKVLREKTMEAVSKIGQIAPVTYQKPVEFTLEYTERHALPNGFSKPYMKVIDGRTFSVTGGNVEEAWYRCL